MLSTLRRKLLWLIAGRVAVATLLLGLAPLIRSTTPGPFPVDPFFALIGLSYALTVVYAATLRYVERHRWLIDVQVAADAIVVSAIVYLTGGVASYFSSLYTLPIIAASTVESRRGGMLVSVLSCVLYTTLVLTQYSGMRGIVFNSGFALPPSRLAAYTVGLNVFGFAAVASLSGYLAEGLRQADAQLQRASVQIEDLQAFSRHIIDSLRSGLATTDLDGRILTFNRAASVITGVSAAEAVGALATEVLRLPDDYQGIFGGRSEGPSLPRVESIFTRPDGLQIELGFSTAPLVTPRGDAGFLLTFQDVTAARKQEREARVQQRLAAVGEMAAGIAHEIRNPLASMAGSIQLLRQELPLTDDQSQLMDIVLRESERLNETIRSFLAYARPQRQTTSRIDVRRVITDAARLLENSSELGDDHDIAVEVPADPVWFEADEGQLRQIVWNLATNGLRAMPNGGRLTLSIRISPPGPRGEVVLAVHDQGTGIAPEDLDGIFQPFRAGFERGTGLGLSIVQRIVAEYGGEIEVTSERGSGTGVLVRFPSTLRPQAEAAAIEQVH
jgi:two-component system sensor histidine kinase PilS (NtrC family)